MNKPTPRISYPEATEKPVIAISIGDINGVGPEIIWQCFATPGMLSMCTPVVFGSGKVMAFYKKKLQIDAFSFHQIQSIEEAQEGKLNLIQEHMPNLLATPGDRTLEGAQAAFASLEAATEAVLKGKADVLITAPLDKSFMVEAGMNFPGHTEYLEHKASGKAQMIMCHESLRVALLTGHMPLEDVAKAISPKLLKDHILRFNQTLIQDFAITKPKIAVLSLNPHAGDQGRFGNQEQEVILPSLKELRSENNLLVAGPFPADGFFGSGNYRNFDGVLAMYHDQGLTGFKSITGFEGVNFTAGLPIVRVSPDHGPAFDLAGTGKANPASFMQAIYHALDIRKCRTMHEEITADPLKISKRKERERDD